MMVVVVNPYGLLSLAQDPAWLRLSKKWWGKMRVSMHVSGVSLCCVPQV